MATRIQGKANGNLSASSIAATFDANVTAGSRIVVVVRTAIAVTMAGKVSDSQANPYTLDVDLTTAGGDMAYFSTVAGSTGALTVTFNAGSAARIGIAAQEFSGLGAYGSLTNNGAATSTTPASGSITIAVGSGATVAVTVSNGEPTWEADYLTGKLTDANGRIHVGYKLITVAGAEQATGTFGGAVAWSSAIAWYQDGAAPPAVLAANAATVALTGAALGLTVGRRVAIAPATVALSAQDLTLRATRQLALALDPAALALSAQALGVRASRRLALEAAAALLSGADVEFLTTGHRAIALEPLGVVLSGGALGLDYSGRVIGVIMLDGSSAPTIALDGSSAPTITVPGSAAPTLTLMGSTHG